MAGMVNGVICDVMAPFTPQSGTSSALQEYRRT